MKNRSVEKIALYLALLESDLKDIDEKVSFLDSEMTLTATSEQKPIQEELDNLLISSQHTFNRCKKELSNLRKKFLRITS